MRKAFLWLVLLTLVLFAQQENKISKGEFLRYEAYLNNSINLSQTHNSTEIIYKDDFSKLGGWFVISGWVMEGNSESERLLTTNKEINYKNNTSYLLESRDIILPNTTHKTKLMYREKFETESEYDFIKILVSSDNGKNWITVDSKSGISDWRESTVDLTTYMGKKIRLRFLMETDDSYSGKGWQIDDITIKTEVRSTLNIQIESLNSQNFPVIYTNVKVDSAGIGISTLTEENFSVYENGVLQTNLFEVIPPETGGGSRLADIVFVVDVSGSMGEEIAAVKANMTSFINALTAAEINFNIGLVTFADLYYVYNSGNLYSSTSQIFNVINAITLGEHGLGNGGDTPENQFGAMAAGADLNYRPGAQRIEIMITDAISHSGNHITPWTQSTLINDKLLPNNISVYPIFNTNAQDQRNQYIPIATATTTSGMYFNVYSNFNVIISEIGSLISDSYVIRYQSSNPNCTGDLRNVLIQVNYLGQTDTSSRSYTSCDLPIIERTTATKNLHNFAHPVGTSFSIDVDVVDNYSPYTNSVRLFYKSSGTSTFSSVSMNNISGTLWRGNIPGSVSVEPGVDYYITATDGITTVSDPKTEPGGYPYQIAILPNVAPVITHTPVTEAILNQPIDIVATIIDNTNFLSQQKLFYRKYGQIIYTEVSMVSTGGMVYLASIPGNMVTMDGVEYYISAWDDFGLRTDHGTRTEPHKIILSVIEADFRAEPTITQVNRNVQFTDLSIPSPTSWEWDFNNDGLTDSYEKNPVYQYLVPGIYTVKLRVSNWQTSSTVVKENFIQVMQLVGEQYYLHYPLDGNATDMSGNGHHAVLQGQTAAEDRFGGVGKALRFDLNYIESPFNFSSQISDTASYHVTVWFKADHIADMTVLGNSSVMPSTHAFLTTSNGGGVYAQINGGTFNGYGANPFDGGWHLITVGTDGNEIMWSVDTWSAGGTDWGSNSGQFLWLGNNQNPMFSLFKGVFDDLRIYKRKLNLTEILDIYNSGNAPEKCYLVYPSNASTEHPPNGLMFQWKKALENQKTILKYQFELATDYQFNNIIVNDSTLTDTTHTVNGLNYASTYYWRVRAKNQVGWGTWSDIWYFSTHSMSSFAIISPNGGENWTVGSTQNIVWNSSNSSDIEIHYTTDDGVSWSLIILSTPVASGSYSWIVPNTPSVNCRVKINEISGSMLSDISDMVFTISESSIGEPTIVFTTPDFTIRNPENDSTAGFGYSQFSENAKAIGRFNNDIYDDLVVVSPLYQNSAGIKVGKAYIYYGSATGLDTLNHH
ncbi:VWA domain-containing protein, partial [Ignavibacterium album]|uniref:VWA domain-containing protein n=1 Tax=Ignavibacterium album TaxID=591197 RepID=UPI0038B30479